MEFVNWKMGLDKMFSDTHKHNSAVHTTATIGAAALPAVAVVGISYGIATVFGFDDFINEKFDISESINFLPRYKF